MNQATTSDGDAAVAVVGGDAAVAAITPITPAVPAAVVPPVTGKGAAKPKTRKRGAQEVDGATASEATASHNPKKTRPTGDREPTFVHSTEDLGPAGLFIEHTPEEAWESNSGNQRDGCNYGPSVNLVKHIEVVERTREWHPFKRCLVPFWCDGLYFKQCDWDNIVTDKEKKILLERYTKIVVVIE